MNTRALFLSHIFALSLFEWKSHSLKYASLGWHFTIIIYVFFNSVSQFFQAEKFPEKHGNYRSPLEKKNITREAPSRVQNAFFPYLWGCTPGTEPGKQVLCPWATSWSWVHLRTFLFTEENRLGFWCVSQAVKQTGMAWSGSAMQSFFKTGKISMEVSFRIVRYCLQKSVVIYFIYNLACEGRRELANTV